MFELPPPVVKPSGRHAKSIVGELSAPELGACFRAGSTSSASTCRGPWVIFVKMRELSWSCLSRHCCEWSSMLLQGRTWTIPAWLWPVAALAAHQPQAAAESAAALRLLPGLLESTLHSLHIAINSGASEHNPQLDS